jgi:hypothetical protein
MKWIMLVGVYFFFEFSAISQQIVNFFTSDSIKLTADLYKSGVSNSWILFFHQEDASRGEFEEIAPKIERQLGYNCLAVDLRYGNKYEYVKNETREYLKSKGIDAEPYDARKDIQAAIRYAFSKSNKPVILFGSSFSASLCLLEGKKNPKVKAVIAFSPGEFFGPRISVRDSISGYDKMVFLASSVDENKYLTELARLIPAVSKTIFTPASGKGLHGAKSLNKICSASNEYWLALSLFFRELAD